MQINLSFRGILAIANHSDKTLQITPSLACAALGIGPDGLSKDPKTRGFFFETGRSFFVIFNICGNHLVAGNMSIEIASYIMLNRCCWKRFFLLVLVSD